MKKKRKIALIISIMLFVISFAVYAEEQQLLRHIASEDCGQCHQQIYDQWKSSMHAQSTALSDPIHGSFYKTVVGDPSKEGVKKGGKYPICLQCHAPTAAKDGKTDITAMPVYNEGVNCVTCHSITKFKGTKIPEGGLRLGMKAYEYSDEKLQGPSGRNIHPVVDAKGKMSPVLEIVGNASVLKTNAVCMGCHDQRKNANKVALCQTGSEISAAKGSDNCQLCHMPVVNGLADHSMVGGHSGKMVSKGMLMTMDVKNDNGNHKVTVNMENKLPHKFPTGAPFRNVYIIVTAFDQNGKTVWRNSQSHPIKDDKKSILMYGLGNNEGKPVPPPMATQVLFDSRLKPHETKSIVYELPGKGVSRIRAEAFYDLLLPPIKEKFSKTIPGELKKPKLIATSEVIF